MPSKLDRTSCAAADLSYLQAQKLEALRTRRANKIRQTFIDGYNLNVNIQQVRCVA